MRQPFDFGVCGLECVQVVPEALHRAFAVDAGGRFGTADAGGAGGEGLEVDDRGLDPAVEHVDLVAHAVGELMAGAQAAHDGVGLFVAPRPDGLSQGGFQLVLDPAGIQAIQPVGECPAVGLGLMQTTFDVVDGVDHPGM